jgi:hypothetical protein
MERGIYIRRGDTLCLLCKLICANGRWETHRRIMYRRKKKKKKKKMKMKLMMMMMIFVLLLNKYYLVVQIRER